MDPYPPDLFEPTIKELVDSFLSAASHLAEASGTNPDASRTAELAYELDQVVSQYLEDHSLSTQYFDSLQQSVLNALAHDLAASADGFIDDVNSASFSDVGLDVALSLLDQHYSGSLLQGDELHYSPSSPDSSHFDGVY